MKVIDKALKQIDHNPQPGWWGFFDGEKHYLMRYNHVMVLWNPGKILYTFYETVTDKKGVNDALLKIILFSLEDLLPKYTDVHLEKMLAKCVENEEYEDAAKIKNEINRRFSEKTCNKQ